MQGFDMGFGFGEVLFKVVPIFIGVVFLIIIGTILFALGDFMVQKSKPKETLQAKIIAKRTQVRGSSGGHHHHGSTSTSYFATFELDGGERKEFQVPSNKIGLMMEGDRGALTFQGTLFVDFER